MSRLVGVGTRPATEEGLRPRTSTSFAWRPVGWFGLLFLVVGIADMALVWYPLRPGNPTWEFGAVDLSFSTLPLLTIGLGAALAAALARGNRTSALLLALFSLLLATVCIGGYLLFLSDVPLALRNSPPELLTGVKKAIFRNTVFGITFPIAFLAVGIAVLRHLKGVRKDGANA